jgi:hypothetical protein
MALGVAVVAALSVLASVFLAPSAQGIAVFMVFGAGRGAAFSAGAGVVTPAQGRSSRPARTTCPP